MELNQLPEGYKGEQKRKTEFEDEKAKLAYDAEKLIAKARESFRANGVEVASKDELYHAIRIIVGANRKDYSVVLDQAINTRFDEDEQEARLHEVQGRESTRAAYEAFIDNAKLSEADALKLKEMMSEANYLLAVESAKELKASKIPTYEQIAIELMTYTPERLKDICAMMEKPELVIESDQSFESNVQAMNDNKHYTAADSEPQEDTYVNEERNSPYRDLNKPGKVKASIVDGVVHPKQLQGVSTRLGERRDHLTAKYAAKKMKHISPKGKIALLQQSMKRAEAAGDNSLIVDNWEKWEKENIAGTMTFLEPSELTESTLVAYSDFDSDSRQACFNVYDPSGEGDVARGRASVQVLEI